MHPATRAHICGMLETVRHALKSIETALAVDSNEGHLSEHLSGAKKTVLKQAALEDDERFLTEEEDDILGEMFGLVGKEETVAKRPRIELLDGGDEI